MEEQAILTMFASHPSKRAGVSQKELRQWNKVIFGFCALSDMCHLPKTKKAFSPYKYRKKRLCFL